MTENLKKVIGGLTENSWDYTFENSIHVFEKYKLKVEIFWHSGEEKIWEVHVYEGESDQPTVVTIADEGLSYPLTLDQGIFIQ